MNSKTTVWLDAVGTADPDSTTTLTAIDTLGTGVVEPAVAAHGGRAIAGKPGTTHLEFAGFAASLAALGQILETSSDSAVGVRAAVGTGLNVQDAEALLALAGSGEVIVAGSDGASAGSEWRSTGVGRTRLPGSGRSADIFRLDRPASPQDKSPEGSSWTRPLSLLPLGGVGFAAAAVALRSADDPAGHVAAEGEAQLDGGAGSLDPNADLDPASGTIAPPEPNEYLPPQVIGGSPEQLEIAADALSRFDTLGLAMPSGLTIYFHEPQSYENCGGHAGRATHGDVEQLDLCTEAPFTLYHELAHAWAYENLDEEQRSEFAELRGLEGWSGPDEPGEDGLSHSELGTEHAADIIAWGVLEGGIRPKSIPDNDDASLAIAFEQLTGEPAPHLSEPDPLGLSVVTGGLSETSPVPDRAAFEDASALVSATSAAAPNEADAAAGLEEEAMLAAEPPLEDDVAGLDAWPDDDDDTPDEDLDFFME